MHVPELGSVRCLSRHLARWKGIVSNAGGAGQRQHSFYKCFTISGIVRGWGVVSRLAVLWAVVVLLGVMPRAAAQAEQLANYTVLLDSPASGKRLSLGQGKIDQRASRRVAASSLASAARAVVKAQDPVITALQAGGAEVLGSVQNVLNAVFIRASAEQVEAFNAIPGVLRVEPSRNLAFKLDRISDVIRLGSARLRPDGTTANGAGVKIAIIDSGLDFSHPAFRDATLPAVEGYPKAEPRHLEYANSKVLAVRSYVHLQNSRQPQTSSPDDLTPLDFNGHGTAVAMIAAGNRINTPAGLIQGIAPKAYLGIYKVDGTPGVTSGPSAEALIAAIDDAVSDGMDVLNLTVGQLATHPWNASGDDCSEDPAMACDLVAVAAQSAVADFGRVVVAPAGNDGQIGGQTHPTRNTVASPGSAPDVISVAATVNSRRIGQTVRIPGNSFRALTGTGPSAAPRLSATAALAEQFGDTQGCAPYPPGGLANRVVVVELGGCGEVDKVEAADKAGAVGVIVYHDDPTGDLIQMEGLEATDIPAYFISAENGAALAASIASATSEQQLPVVLDARRVSQPMDSNQVAPFSSRGPTPGLSLKPDIAAPGAAIFATAGSSPGATRGGYKQVQGTSFAASVVAGAAALVWQMHPDWTAREVGSALINTASTAVQENGEAARVGSVGSGLLSFESAFDPIATVVPPTIGFGRFTAETLPAQRDVTVTNRSSAPQQYRVEVVQRDADSLAGVNVNGFSEATFQLQPAQKMTLSVSLGGAMPVPGSYEGHLRVTRQGSDDELRVPYLYVVGDNQPEDAFSIGPRVYRDFANDHSHEWVLGKFVDRYGAPVVGRTATWGFRESSGHLVEYEPLTSAFGLAPAMLGFGDPSDAHVIGVATVGDVELRFDLIADVYPPHVTGVANAANPSANGPVAPGSVAVIAGAELTEFSGQAPEGDPPITLKSVSVSFDHPDSEISVAAPVFSVDAGQVQVQVPWELAGISSAHAKVRVMDRYGWSWNSAPFLVQLADLAPGVYSFETDNGEVASAVHSDGSYVTAGAPARAGQTITVYMTGTGPFSTALESGQSAARSLSTLHSPVISVGGAEASVVYSGSIQGAVGITKVDFVVPSTVTAGNAEVAVSIDGNASNAVTIPVQ